MTRAEHTTWVEINRNNLIKNIKILRSIIGEDVLLVPTVKANAYGHGIRIAGEAFAKGGADWLAVHSIEEALLIRKYKIDLPVLILGYVPISKLKEAVLNNFKLTIYDKDHLERLGKITEKEGRRADVHLKVETGINRQGLPPFQVLELATLSKRFPFVNIEGLSSHFANIEDTTSMDFAEKQLAVFRQTIKSLNNEGFAIPIKHIANSAATILYPETHFDMVRPGIASYGFWPAEITKNATIEKNMSIKLEPAFTWKSMVAQVKKIQAGAKVGYGCTYTAEKDMSIAIIPVGYYEGYDRLAGEKGYVLISGKRAKVIGRVCMNNIIVDVDDVDKVEKETEVVLLGKQETEEITVEEFASWTERINYEIPTRVSIGVEESIPRIAI